MVAGEGLEPTTFGL